uniref:Uncharacterized protein n=1 Tax=Meloidogyne javanica TaxID=6303 RepID=A0A915MZ31_MELJA
MPSKQQMKREKRMVQQRSAKDLKSPFEDYQVNPDSTAVILRGEEVPDFGHAGSSGNVFSVSQLGLSVSSMDVAATTSRNDSPFLSAMGGSPSTSNDSPFLSSRTMIRSDCPEKVSRFDESNVSCLDDESIVSLDIDSDSSCALPICSSSKRGRGRPRKIIRKGAGRPRKVSICDSVPDECVIINDEPIIFLAPDPPDMPVRQSVPVQKSYYR